MVSHSKIPSLGNLRHPIPDKMSAARYEANRSAPSPDDPARYARLDERQLRNPGRENRSGFSFQCTPSMVVSAPRTAIPLLWNLCVVDDAAWIEPVSSENSLLTGKITGNFRFHARLPAQRIPYANDFGVFKRNSLLNGIRIFLIRTGNCIQAQGTSAAPPQPHYWDPPAVYFLFLRLQLRFVRGNERANVGRHIQ